MKSWRFTRLLSLILVLAMLIQMMPVQSFAASTGSSAVDVSSGQPATTVLGEVEDLREEDTKHFRLSDGSFIAVSYGMPVHYEDEDGNWEDIDNTIVQNSETSTYQLNREDAVVSFANALTNGTVLNTSKDGKSITMSVLDTNQAVQMIAGEETAELMGEEEAETQAAETVPEEVVDETVHEETETATEPEETVAETVPEETKPVTAPEETVEETEPEETIPETTVAVVEDEVQATVAETVAEAVDTVSDTTEATEVVETEPAVAAASVDETAAEETAPEEAAGETVETQAEEVDASETLEETTAATIPEETEAPTVPEETTAATVPEETAAVTEPEETIPETTVAESETIGEMDTDAVVAPVVTGGVTFDRTATAEIAAERPSMLSLQETDSWKVEDIIPEKLQSSLLYENVFPDTDLLYTAFGHNIKEQIVVNKPQADYRYDFLLDLDGLTATLNEDGSVSFADAEENLVYRIPVPFMEDEAGVLSDAVEFVLNETAQGLVLTVEADAAWINAEEREFPVKIDPSFVIYSGSALDQIYSNYTMEAAPNDTTLGRQYLYVGAQPYSTSNDGRYRTFMHFNDMPDIPAGYEVVGAQLQLYQQLYTQRYCPSFPVGIYEVTTSLPSSYSSYYKWFTAMTWRNNMPSYDTSNVIDYVMVDSTKGYRYWNITELVKKWYAEGTDNTTCALVMMNEDEIDTYYYYASVAFLAYASTIPPILIVSYRNNTGIEPYYTYATLGGASAGTAYVADATGQLKVGKELVSYESSANPFSLSLVYNSDYFALTPGTDYQPPSKQGLSMNVGSGWTLDVIQKVEPETITDIDYLKYTDGDGTIHYFMEDSEKKAKDTEGYTHFDEDGLGLKMKVNSTNNYTMADDKGNTWTFTNNYLTCITDGDGNKTNITYSSGKITEINQVNNGQASVRVAKFTYNGNNLESVQDAAENVYKLIYNGTKLASIQRDNSTIASYTYDGYRLNKMTDTESSYSLAFTYEDGKVSSYKEMGGSTTGAYVGITYPNHSQTTYRDSGNDRVLGNEDDIITNYLFDYARRTANAVTTDYANNVIGATNAAYSANKETDKTNNRTVRTATIGVAGQQLLKNTSIESTSNAWTFSGTSRSSNKPRTGSYAVYGTQTAGSKIYAQKSSESLTAGVTYTLSAYVNTTGISSFSDNGIYLQVANGSNTWKSSPINYKTASEVDDGWVRVSVTFTALASGTHTVSIVNDGCNGYFYADDFQLEKGDAPSSHNLVENGGMEMSSHGWTMGSGASYATNTNVSNNRMILINGDPTDKATNAYQDIIINQTVEQTYVLSGWVYANAVPDDDKDPDDVTDTSKECGLRAVVTYSDGSTKNFYAPFNTDLSNTWQFVSLTIVPDEEKTKVTNIRVVCVFEGNANFAYFDNISLMREAAQTMRYDEDGNLVSVLSPGLKEDENTFSNGNLIKTVTGGYGTYSYNYENSTYKHRLTSVSNDLIKQTMGYDGAGNVTSTTLSKKDGGTKSISTSSVYEGNLNRLVSMTDSNGATTTYGYGTANAQMMALPTSITDAKGTVTSNIYDDNYRVDQTTIANAATVAYDYSSGNLASAVRTNNDGIAQTYNFEYDAFGNMTKLKVGSDVLVTYSYNTGNGLLLKETYANGAWVSYGYDNLGRIKTTSYSDGRMLNYVYNGEGRLHSVTETSNAGTVTYLYTYDSLGRLINTEQKQGNTSALRTHVDYNEYNQISGQSWQMGDTAYSETYEYNSQNGSLTEMTTGVNDTLTMGYDELQRLSTVSGKFGRTYSYKDINSTQTTTLVSNLSYSGLASTTNFDYTYDVLGNISEYTAPDGEKITYTYDAQGQLKKAVGNNTYTYDYDSVGNIKSANGHSYTYGTGNWKDLLVAYDGQSISYDASGNPTSYYNGTRWNFTWANGRNLATAADGTTNASFNYDSDGLRTSKTVGTATTNYLYSEGKLLRQTSGSNTWDFFYDANGVPYALKYNGTVYYYITNLQGDVIQLVNASGTAVATYEYDPYGNVIEATGNMAEINPLRYRGYYYDSETELYYLESRYYDPAIGRFINADDVDYLDADTSLAAMDLFAYCANDPVNRFDDAGNLSLPNWAKVAIGVGIIAICAVATVATGGAAAGTLLAAVNCAATGALVGSVTQGAIGAVSGAVSGAVTHRLSTGSWKGAEKAALNGAATGFMTGTITGAISGAVSSPYCFVAGTTVLTAAGTAAIEAIQVGDQVWAWDEDTGKVAVKEVVETYVNETDELIHVYANGEEIVTTPSHPFYSPVKGWTDAVQLRAGDILVLVNGEYVVVEKVLHEILEKAVTVYNFQVEDFHTYFVSNFGILVHNTCGGRGQLRKNMLKEGSAPGKNYQAHHGLPWKNRDYFGKAGLNVNDARFGRWVKGGGNGGHQSWSGRYGALWDNYIARHPVPDANDIIDYFGRLNGLR